MAEKGVPGRGAGALAWTLDSNKVKLERGALEATARMASSILPAAAGQSGAPKGTKAQGPTQSSLLSAISKAALLTTGGAQEGLASMKAEGLL